MKYLAVFASIVLTAGLSACASMQKEVKDTQWSYTPNPNTGAVIVSVVDEHENPEAKSCICPTLYFREAATKKNSTFLQTCDAMMCTFQDGDIPGAHGEIYLLELPAGSYEFHNFSENLSTGVGSRSITAAKDFSMPFNVEAGKIKYIGEAKLKEVNGKNVLGMSIPAGAIPSMSDQHERDLPAAKKKFPKLQMEQVMVDVKPAEPFASKQ